MSSDRLTITITGPAGCGKTLVADWIAQNLPRHIRAPYASKGKLLSQVLIVDGDGADRTETQL